MKGDRVEALVDTGQGVQRFEISATRAGRRIEVTTSRGIVEVTEVTRGGNPVRTGRFMASRLVALVEHPALEGADGRLEVTTQHRLGTGRSARRAEAETARGGRRRSGTGGSTEPEQLRALLEEEARGPDPADMIAEAERSGEDGAPEESTEH